MSGRPGNHLPITDIFWQKSGKMNSGIRIVWVKPVRCISLQRIEQSISPRQIDIPYTPQVAGKVSLADEIGQDKLIKSRRKNVERFTNLNKSGKKFLWHNHITEPQGWK